MAPIKRSSKGATVEALVTSDPDLMKALMKQALQEVLENKRVGASSGETMNYGTSPTVHLHLPPGMRAKKGKRGHVWYLDQSALLRVRSPPVL